MLLPGWGHLQGAELRWLELHLARGHRTSYGEERRRPVVVVRLVGDEAEGWGECSAVGAPSYTSEYAEGAWTVLRRHLLPLLLAGGREEGEAMVTGGAPELAWAAARHALGAMGGVRGHAMARASAEMAVVDGVLRASGRSLAEALGVTGRTVEAGATVAAVGEEPGALVEEVAELVEVGFRRVRCKIAPGWDVAPLQALREAFPELVLQADANGAYRWGGAVGREVDARRLLALDELKLGCVEQPLAPEDLLGHAELARQMATPVALDESLDGPRRVAEALALGACGAVCLKPAALGGLLAARLVEAQCRAAGVPLWCGGMLETGLGRAAVAAVSGLPGAVWPGDVGGGRRFVEEDPFSDPDAAAGSSAGPAVGLHLGPGVGPEPETGRLTAVTDRLEWLAAPEG